MNRGAVLLAIGLAACSPRGDERAPIATTTAPAAPAASATSATSATALLPTNASPLAPSHLVAANVDGQTITETESCAGCHADAAAQWQTSAHAFGSLNNPAYRVVIDRFRKEVGKDQSRFCGGCHDVALLVDGAMASEIAADDFRAHGGVTCRVCHGVESVRPDGNGSYTLASTPIPIPKPGAPASDDSVRLHKERMALAPLRTAQMCGGCHRAFLGAETGNVAHLVGQDDLTAWQRSGYAGNGSARIDAPFEKAECRTCHMPREDAPSDAAAKNGKIASHRFLGAHTWLASMRGDADGLARARAMLRGAASIDVAAAIGADGTRTLPADGAPVVAGAPIVLDVVVRNQRVGHRFPGGTVDAQDVWIELVVKDAHGRVVADAGTQHETKDDATAHTLRASPIGDDGRPLLVRETEKFRAAAYDHTLAPRDAEVVRYRLDVPKGLAAADLPLVATARLRHRSRGLALFEATCASTKTPRGRAFTAAVTKRTGVTLDACAPQPITDVAEASVALGVATPPDARAWQRLFDHALGMVHALQEQVDDARPSLDRALALLPATATRERAMVAALYAALAVREGRTDEALAWLDRADALVPGHPATGRLRGEALSNVWRWSEAIAPLRASAAAAPGDDAAWMRLAVAYGSAAMPVEALEAAQRGLLLQPRDADMLRVQSLALDALRAPASDAERARAAFLAFRPPDDAPALRALCSDRVPGCALERIPVHVHAMRAPR